MFLHLLQVLLYTEILMCINFSPLINAQSVEVSFNDTRCEDGGIVSPADPLLFTCNVTDVGSKRITLRFPTGHRIRSYNNEYISGVFPNGVAVQNYSVVHDYYRYVYDYTLTLSIEMASLLNDGLIICDSNEFGVADGVAGCPVTSVQSVEASFNDTRCGDGGGVCPTEPLLFTCNVTGSTNDSITVQFPTRHEVDLNDDNTTMGEVSGDLPDGVTVHSQSVVIYYIPTQNKSAGIHDYILTLSIMKASLLNGSSMICDSNTNASDVAVAGCPVVDVPDSPLSLTHDVSANTVSSAVIRWDPPSSTGGGGISITKYRIMSSDNGLSLNETVDDMTYTITGLQYNTNYRVEVAAINSCGLESKPASVVVRIEARVPPTPTLLPPELHCDIPLENGRPVVIKWMLGDEAEDVVYPGAVEARVDLDPGDITCSSVTAGGTSCTVSISSEGIYNINLTLTNDVGSTQYVVDTVDLTTLKVEGVNSAVNVTLNPLCHHDATYTVQVFIGVRQQGSDEGCVPQQNISANIVPGESVIWTVDASLVPGQEYCSANVSGFSDGNLSAGVAAGIAVAILLVALLVGVVIGCSGSWCIWRRGRGPSRLQNMKLEPLQGGVYEIPDPEPVKTKAQQKQDQGGIYEVPDPEPVKTAISKAQDQLQGGVYEVPDLEPVETAIPLTDNQAYGHVNM